MKYFFILSLGRSGTKFFSKMLSSIENIEVQHEPFLEDRNLINYSYLSEIYGDLAEQHLQYRFKKVDKRLNDKHGVKTYGEVNSYLRYCSNWLEEKLNAKIIYVVRDGRDYVRSAYSRDIYTMDEPQCSIVPKNNDKYVNKWYGLSRFEKICWYWMSTNEYLLEKSRGKMLQFEKLISDYDYFEKGILIPLSIEGFNKSKWEKMIISPTNTSRNYIMRKRIKGLLSKKLNKSIDIGNYSEWNEKMISSFNVICKNTMDNLGYH